MFKITKLILKNHPVLKNQTIKFVEDNEFNNESYVSFLIGQNGTGKSQILSAVLDILNHISNDFAKQKWKEDYNAILEIFNDDKLYVFDTENEFDLKLSGVDLKNILPSVLLANAYTFNDRFSKNENSFYKYGGLKTTNNSIFLNKPIEKTFENLMAIIDQKENIELLNELFNELNLKKRLRVYYQLRRNKAILTDARFIDFLLKINDTRKITNENINEFIRTIRTITRIDSNTTSRRFQDDKIKRILNIENKENLKLLIAFFLNNLYDHGELITNLRLPFDNSSNAKMSIELRLVFEFDWVKRLNAKSNKEFIEHIKIYKILSDLDIISFTELEVQRDEYFNSEKISSGEFHLLHLFTFIASNIKENSLLIMDEPEISLHVNWQYLFFKLLQPLIVKYNNSHFIIASHSHFLVSDLKKESSSIISLTRDETGNIISRNLETINTFGWSAEQILFDVFKMPSDRNYYLSSLVEEIITEMSKTKTNKTDKVLKSKIDELTNFDTTMLKDSDPMKSIILDLLKI